MLKKKYYFVYKIKKSFITVDTAHAKIEDFGFKPVFNEDEWAHSWAKSKELLYDNPEAEPIKKWTKLSLEQMYKQLKDKTDDWSKKMMEELNQSGIQFDQEGHAIENEALKENYKVYLCVFCSDKVKKSTDATLFVSYEGNEFYSTETLNKMFPKTIESLKEAGALYTQEVKAKQ